MTNRRTLHPDAARALGALLSVQRDKVGKTQQNIADFAGVSLGYYRTLERGSADYASKRVSNPSIAMIIDVAHALDLDPAALIEIVVQNHGTVESKSSKPAPSEASERPQH